MNVHLPVLMFADDLCHYHKCELSTESILRAGGCASLYCKGFHAALVIMQEIVRASRGERVSGSV